MKKFKVAILDQYEGCDDLDWFFDGHKKWLDNVYKIYDMVHDNFISYNYEFYKKDLISKYNTSPKSLVFIVEGYGIINSEKDILRLK